MFAAGEAGVWFEPTDLATLFKDAAATVPAVVGELVRRINDKSGRGKHMTAPSDAASPILRQHFDFPGAEKVVNGTFDANTNSWVASNATLTLVANKLRVTNTAALYGYAYQAIPCTIGNTYRLTVSKGGSNNAGVTVSVGGGHGLLTFSSTGDPIEFVASSATMYISLWAGGNVAGNYCEYDLVSLKEGVASENYYLEFDGVDDVLANTTSPGLTVAQGWHRISALRIRTWANVRYLMTGGANSVGGLVMVGSSPKIALYDGTAFLPNPDGPAVGYNGVITELHKGAQSSLQLNNSAAVVGNPGSSNPLHFSVGANSGGAQNSRMRFYGTIAKNAMTDAEIADVKAYLAALAGVVL